MLRPENAVSAEGIHGESGPVQVLSGDGAMPVVVEIGGDAGRSARWLPWPVRALSCPLTTVNGKPLLHATMEVMFQPPTRKFATRLAGLDGQLPTPEKLKTCVRS